MAQHELNIIGAPVKTIRICTNILENGNNTTYQWQEASIGAYSNNVFLSKEIGAGEQKYVIQSQLTNVIEALEQRITQLEEQIASLSPSDRTESQEEETPEEPGDR